MTRPQQALLVLTSLMTVGCGAFFTAPPTLGDPANAPATGYTPIDPLPVAPDSTGFPAAERLLTALPDETMRIAIGEVQSNGTITFGPAKAGTENRSYVVILDYIKFQTQPFEAEILVPDGGTRDSTVLKITGILGMGVTRPVRADTIRTAIVPVYLGVGLRMTATVTVTKGSVDLGNLLAIGAAAQAQRATGTLTVQTLGISGPGVSNIIPMPSDINQTTIQNAILALGAIKTKLYDNTTLITPRVVGVYNTLGGGQRTINSFIAALLKQPVPLIFQKRN